MEVWNTLAKISRRRIHREAISTYTEDPTKPYDHQNRGVGTYTEMGAYSGQIRQCGRYTWYLYNHTQHMLIWYRGHS